MARVVLIEAGPRVLAGYPDDLSGYALRSLESLNVEVALGQAVSECTEAGVIYGDRSLASRTIIWAAGVQASAAASWVGAPVDRAGRLLVLQDLTVPGHPEIFAIGDTVALRAPDGKPVPGIAPAAKQAGRHVAKTSTARDTTRDPGGQAVMTFEYAIKKVVFVYERWLPVSSCRHQLRLVVMNRSQCGAIGVQPIGSCRHHHIATARMAA
jgi:NADH dehydrogenase FAD-containing subunit